MANSIRNILTLYGTLPEVDRFVGGFLRGGLGASMPIPPDANPGYKYSETWGACPEGGDVEVLTDTSIVAGQIEDSERPHIRSIKANWVNNNTFTLISHHKEIGALDLPGFVGQDKTPIALIVFYTKWKFPFIWIEAVINRNTNVE